MNMRFELTLPDGRSVQRDVVDGRWAEPERGAQETFGHGLFALPGLVDAHAHLAVEELSYGSGVLSEAIERAEMSLAAGVTLVLDKGWGDRTTLELIERLPPTERPEIEAAGRIIAPPEGYYPDFAREVSPDGLLTAVSEEAEVGAGWVKLIGDWPRKGVGPQAELHGRGACVSGCARRGNGIASRYTHDG